MLIWTRLPQNSALIWTRRCLCVNMLCFTSNLCFCTHICCWAYTCPVLQFEPSSLHSGSFGALAKLFLCLHSDCCKTPTLTPRAEFCWSKVQYDIRAWKKKLMLLNRKITLLISDRYTPRNQTSSSMWAHLYLCLQDTSDIKGLPAYHASGWRVNLDFELLIQS